MKFFSAFLAFAMVLSLLSPIASAANKELVTQFKPDRIDESIMQQKAAIAEQLDLLGGEARLHEDLQKVSGNQQVAVIVHLSEKSVALQKGIKELAGKKFTATEESSVRAKVKAQQTLSKKEMTIKKINFKVGYSFDTVLNGFAATVKADDIPKLLKITGVTLVEPDTQVHAFQELKPTKTTEMKNKELKSVENATSDLIKQDEIEAKMNTSISFLGIEKLWNEGFEGQGIKVAVLDTGIDANHPEFAGNYKGGKNFVPHTGSDYARPRADNDGSETSPLDRPANRPEFNERGSAFYTSHGTHVAGTIAALGNNPYGIKGIAPKVDLYAYRVLGAYGSGSTSGIIKAIDTAVIEKMDVINLSLGGGANSETDGGSFAINNAMLAGTIAAIATGNSGPNRGTMGTPSTARLGIAVANTTNPEVKHKANATLTAGSYQYAKQLNLMATTFGKKLETQLQGDLELIAVPGNGKAADYVGINVAGKVALISRGEIAFVDKIAFAKENGAVAAIIHNFAGGSNAPGESGTFLGDSFDFIPTFDMSVTDATEIRAALQTEKGTISFASFASTKTTGDEVNNSSSRGPSTPNFDIKPDVSAPGTNIMSSIPQYGADFPDAKYDQSYDRFTGTSMATPHIAGIAALVKQANPTWNAFDVKVALSNTAKLLDTAKYDVFSQGAGRVDAYAAAHPSALAYAIDTANNDGAVVENLKGTVTFGPQSLKENLTVTKQIRVKDIKGTGGNYAASVDVKKGFGDATLTIDKPTFTLAGEELLTVTLTASKNASVKVGDEFLGYIHITGGGTEISLPFAADFGGAAADEFKNFKITETDLSFNGDGVKDSAVLSFTLTGDVTTNYIELWDIMNPTGGEFADGYIGYLHAGAALAAGSYTLNVTGKYTPWTTAAPQSNIPDGLYTIDFSGKTVSGNPATLGGYIGPVIVKSQAGTIEGTLSGTKATGKVVDKYIDYNIELAKYDLEYELNTKLKATYDVVENEVVTKSGNITLEPDGAFAFDTGALKKGATVVVKYVDAAGNKAQQVLATDGTTIEYKVDQEKLALKVGEKAQLKVTETTTKADGTTTEKDVTAEATFASVDTTIATVEGSTVTAVAAGTSEITVTYKDFTAKVAVEVTAPAAQDKVLYSISKKELKLGVGQQEQLIVTETTTKADGTVIEKDATPHVNFNVVNNTIATVQNGLVTAKAAGQTQVRVLIPGQEAFFVYLEVSNVPQDIVTYSINKKQLTLGVGQQEQLIITETTDKVDGTIVEKDITPQTKFAAVDNTVAKVNKGLVSALKAGKTQVKVMIPGQDERFVYIEVKDVPQDIVSYNVSETDLTLQVGKQKQLKVIQTTVKPSGQILTKDVTGQSKYNVVNNTIATVQLGLVTAKKAGKTQVRVVTPDGDVILVYLTVKEGAAQNTVSYAVNKDNVTLKVGGTEQLTVTETTTTPTGTVTVKDITTETKFQSANPSVVTLNKGLVTAVAAGETTIAVTHPKFTTVVKALVTPADIVTTELRVTPTELTLVGGDKKTVSVLSLQTTNGQAISTDVTKEAAYSGFDPAIVSVQQGTLTAISPGTTTITVKHGTETATIRVTVEAAMQKIVITEADISEFITNKKAKQILINVPTYDKEIAIELSATVLNQIVKSEKELLFTSNGTTIEFEDDATKELLKKTGGNTTIILGKAPNTTNPAALSDEISIALYSGFGDSKQIVPTLKEEIEITIQIDESKLAKNGKVEVLDLSTNKTLKAKAKKGIVEFETKSSGKFLVIKK